MHAFPILATIVLLLNAVSYVYAQSDSVGNGPPPIGVIVENTPDVNVVNQPTVNIGGTADVNVVNTPTVQSEQAGEWDVNVVGTPGVTIENGPLEPIPVAPAEQYPRQPFQVTNVTDRILDGLDAKFTSIFTPPNDKLAIIEMVSINAVCPIGQRFLYIRISTRSDLSENVYYLSIFNSEPVSTSTHDWFTGTQQVRLYSDGTLPIHFAALRNSDSGECILHYGISGYLIPSNSPSLAP